MQTYDIFIRAIKPFSLYYIPLGFSSLSSIAINHIIQSPTNNVEKNYFKIVPALHRETTFLAGPHPQPQGKMDKLKFEKNIHVMKAKEMPIMEQKKIIPPLQNVKTILPFMQSADSLLFLYYFP